MSEAAFLVLSYVSGRFCLTKGRQCSLRHDDSTAIAGVRRQSIIKIYLSDGEPGHKSQKTHPRGLRAV